MFFSVEPNPDCDERSTNSQKPTSSKEFLTVPPDGHASATLQTPEGERVRSRLSAPTLLLVVLTLYFCWLGQPPLFDPDEGRHAEVAREAIVTGNWVTPTLNFQPYHHKPMPFYWLVAAGVSAFPAAPEFGARLPSAIAATATVLSTAWWASRFFGPQVAFWTGVVLATAAGFVTVGRAVLVDMTFTWWVTASHLLLGWFALSRKGAALWPLPWVCIGLAVLFKGPSALLLLVGSGMFYCVVTRQWSWLHQLRPARGLVLAVAIAGSWYLCAAVVAPEYLRDFLWLHNVERFVTGRPGHPNSLFYYFYILPAVFLPWTLWWPLAARPVFRSLAQHNGALLFCASWALSVVGFFTLSKGKLPTYVLPALPPLAVLTATGLVAFSRLRHWPRWAMQWTVAVHAVLSVVAIVMLAMAWPVLRLLGEPELAAAVTCLSAVGATVLAASYWWYRGQFLPVRRIACIAIASGVVELSAYRFALPMLGPRYSLYGAAQALQQFAKDAELCSYDAGINSLLFYSGRAVRELQSVDEAAELLARDRATVVLTKHPHIDDLVCATKVPLVSLWAGERNKVLVANPASMVGKPVPSEPLLACPRVPGQEAHTP